MGNHDGGSQRMCEMAAEPLDSLKILIFSQER
jgi:hypothetical protein